MIAIPSLIRPGTITIVIVLYVSVRDNLCDRCSAVGI